MPHSGPFFINTSSKSFSGITSLIVADLLYITEKSIPPQLNM